MRTQISLMMTLTLSMTDIIKICSIFVTCKPNHMMTCIHVLRVQRLTLEVLKEKYIILQVLVSALKLNMQELCAWSGNVSQVDSRVQCQVSCSQKYTVRMKLIHTVNL